MFTNAPQTEERIAIAIDPDPGARDVRAVCEYMTVLLDGPGVKDADDLYVVYTQSGGEYTVDAREGACECPDAQFNLGEDELCKHARRVAIIRRERAFPLVEVGEVDDALGEHVEGGLTAADLRDPDVETHIVDAVQDRADDAGTAAPPRAMTDGGQNLAPRTSLIEGERPLECNCSPVAEDLPCWFCWEAGFRLPNPDVTDG